MSKLIVRSWFALALMLLVVACESEPATSVAVGASSSLPDARCRVGMNIILGTPNSDVLTGTSGDDCIIGYDANDTINGLGGNDVLIGGPANDTISGGDGNDDVYGDAGDDTVRGDDGADRVYGAAGVDVVLGGNGNDIVDGGDGNDRIDGESGDDNVVGDDGCDTINAATGADSVAAGPGDDVVNAGAAVVSVTGSDGNDWIAGGVSASVVNGNNGTDHCLGTSCEQAPPTSCASSASCPTGKNCSPTAHLCVASNFCGGFAGGGACVFPDGGGGGGDGGVPCDDGNVCTADSCDGTGCHNTAVTDGTACDDSTVCDGHETCGTGTCQPGTPLVVDDGNACTTDSCDPVTGVHHTPVTPDMFPDSSCNGVDDDCDGHLDEDYISTATSCGTGACAASGTTSCVGGVVSDSCHAGSPTPDTTCDGIDDDCNGIVDDHYAATTTSCGTGACSAHGTTSCSAGHVVDSCHAGSPTGPDTTCDGIDDDCNALVDDHYAPITTSCGVGVCGAHGATSCSSGHVVDSCHAGSPTGPDTTCDGLDDDCNGAIDDHYAPTTTTCGVGVCSAHGATSCSAGHIVDSCHEGSPTGADTTCDGLDDDCNGVVDDHYASHPTSCGLGVCGSTGATSCVSGAVVDSCHAGAPTGTDTTCDSLDDDCDGHVDEAYASHPTSCGIGVCSAAGATSCVSGAVVDSCHAGTPTGTDATCDGLDEDCDGRIDEAYASVPTNCGLGVCAAAGSTSCSAGVVIDSCHAGTATGPDGTCNATDEDCDGRVDEAYVGHATSCGLGVCGSTGATTCVSGAEVDSCHPGTATGGDTTCDGLDDDCDGHVDESYAPVSTHCGLGVCTATGTTSCVAGAVTDSCAPSAPTGTDVICDGLDDDCDGHIDESYAPHPSTCGVGVCTATGATSCVAGAVVDTCSPGAATGTDVICDGLDDDCDGHVDESYASVATTCGLGVCHASGATHCAAGTVVDSCTPAPSGGPDTSCDGLDEDCDGATDEAFVSTPTSCGVGACSRTGATACVAGATTDSCTAGSPTGSDSTCDGIDDDCDGTVDEAFVPTVVSCGLGLCLAHGTTACLGGAVQAMCTPLPPTGPDTTCDTLDDDCDGVSDESFVSFPTTCGIGVCASVGAATCVSGAVLDSCLVGTPTSDDSNCNGADDDCDAFVDEGFTPSCAGATTVFCTSGALVTHDCSDHDACTGVESCNAATCIPGAPPVVNDGNACTADSCDPVTGVHHVTLTGASCSDGNVCNGAEICNASAVCTAGTPLPTDDHNVCTADACDPLTGVTHTLLPDGASCDDGDPCNGIETCDPTGACLPGPHPLSGPCTPAAPVARIFVDEERDVSRQSIGAAIASFTGTTTPSLSGGFTWNPSSLASGPVVVLDLAGSDAVALDHFAATGQGPVGMRHFEWSVSTVSATSGFSTPVAAEAPNTTSTYTIPLNSVSARWLRLHILDNWGGQVGQGSFQLGSVWTRPRDGGGVSVAEGGASASATSVTASFVATRAIDADPTTNWLSGAPVAGQTLTVDLSGTDWQRLDRVRMRGTGSTSAIVQDFEVWGSSAGTSPSDFTFLFSGKLPQESSDLDYHFFFPETSARYLQLRVLTNRGFTGGVSVYDFQAITPHEGGMTVPFESRSIAGGTPIVTYRWDFGDGTLSERENPIHTFPAPGTYDVRLEVQDAWGLRSTTSYVYMVDAPPVADFSYTPSAPVEGGTLGVTDRSVAGDAPLVRASWSFNLPGTTVAPSTTGPGGSRSVSVPGFGNASVTLTMLDAHFLRSTLTQTIPIGALPPRIDVGSDQTIYWGQAWTPITSPLAADATGFAASTVQCHYDFGDGTTLNVTSCNSSNVFRTHTWTTPGGYEVVVTVTDSTGLSASDRFFVEVIRHPTSVGIDAIPGASAGGLNPVVAHLMDRYDPSTAISGRTVALDNALTHASSATNASGVATSTLDFGTGSPDLVIASFAGDVLYEPASLELAVPEPAVSTAPTNCGTDFWLPLLQGNCASPTGCPDLRATLSATADQTTTMVADVADIGYHGSVIVGGGSLGRLTLPYNAIIYESGVRRSHAAHVTSSRPICLNVWIGTRFAADSFLALPTAQLGRDHVVASYIDNTTNGSEFAIAGTVDGTSIVVNSPVELAPGASTPASLPANTPFTLTLNRGEIIQLRTRFSSLDLTGTRVTASAPIAVTGGAVCPFVPPNVGTCDSLVEQLPSIDRLGRDYVVPPLGGRTSGYLMRVIAATSPTTVQVDGATVATLSAGQFYELNTTAQLPHAVTTSASALVVQYAKGQTSDAVGDPMFMVIPPSSSFGHSYRYAPPPSYVAPSTTILVDYIDRVTLVARTADVGGVRFDEAPVSSSWLAIGTSGWAYTSFVSDDHAHTVRHLAPGVPVGAYNYGWSSAESYGSMSFMRLVPDACTPTTMTPGDGRDNECDGRIDEELANGIDDDGDGLVDEDLDATSGSPVNVPPVAFGSTVGTREDTPVAFVLSGFDPNGDALTYQVLTTPSAGTITGTAPSLTYTPAANANGLYTLTFRTCDPSSACSAPATVTLDVRAVNDPPNITMTPIVSIVEDGILQLPCVAAEVDVDLGCALTWALVSGPPGMTLDPATGNIFWAPGEGSGAFNVPVTVRVTDCHGASSTFTFGIQVGQVFDAPFITSRPVTSAIVGRLYSYTVTARDPDLGDVVTFQFHNTPPAGMTINSTTGVVSWTPTIANGGLTYPIEVVAIDNHGLMSSPQRYDLRVAGDTNAPTLTITATRASMIVGETSIVHVAITDDLPGAVIDGATIGGVPVTLDGSGNTTFTATATGVYLIVATGHDASGNPGTATSGLRVLTPGDNVPPVVQLTAPDDAAVLTYLHEATGSVSDSNLYRWTLSLRRVDRGPYVTIASGSSNVSGHLATIDTTQLEDGVYAIRLYGEDVNGQSASDIRTVRVDGEAKVGVVQLSFTDLVSDAIGIPVAIVRTYDSRVAATGRVEDFGVGWSLELRHGQVAHNRPPGEGFAITSQGGFTLPCSEQFEQLTHFTEVRLSESEWYVFHPSIVNVDSISGSCSADVVFEQSDGVHPGATLTAFGPTRVRATALPLARGIPTMPSDLTDMDTGEVYNPQRFQLTLRDGRQFVIGVASGIEQACDANHNCVSITSGGITSTSGPGLTIVRDARGRITQAIASDGRSIGYEYATNGNLATFIDAMSRRTTFEYRNATYTHHLTDIVDWRGVRVAALDYQSDGRVGQTCDPEGRCLHNTYDIGSQVMTTSDSLGVPTQYTYDARGNVTLMRDGLGHETTYMYETRCSGHLLARETDPLGNTTIHSYDFGTCDLGAVIRPHTAAEDPEVFTTHYTYDSAGHQLSERLESGGTYHREYDASGNQTRVADDANTTVFGRTFDGQGRLLTETDRFGTTTYTYTGVSPHPTHVVDGRGQTFDFTYDLQGHLVTATSGSTTMTYRYDPAGRLRYADYGRGVTVSYAYGDDTDQWTRISGPTFGTASRTFSASGRLIGWTLPNGDTHSRVYDAAGRLSSETDELGHVTTHHYDDAGRLDSTTDVARGATTTYVRDDAGRVLSTIDPLHHTTSRTYDVRGAMATMTDADSHTWTYATTPTSSTSTTPTGDTTTSASTTYGLPGSTTFPGGASTASAQHGTTSLDESYRFPQSRTDEGGRTRSFGYDAASALTSATDLGGHAWGYTYSDVIAGDVSFDIESGRMSLTAPEAEGNVSRFSSSGSTGEDALAAASMQAFQRALHTVTSPLGDATTYHYDAGGHRDTVTLPSGGVHAMTFLHGHLDTETLPFGTMLSYTRDAAFRVTERTGTDGSLHGMTYRPGDRVDTITDATGTTTYDYDAAGRFAGLDYPTGGSVHIGRDALDQVTTIDVRAPADATVRETTYVRDAANHITEIHDPLGGITYQTYDSDGRLSTRTLPNGIVSTWTYDSRSRVDTVVHARADHSVIVSVDYDRNPSGEPFRIMREDGTFVLYGYDSALRLTSERYFDATSTQVDAITYTYDDDGNRTSRTTSAGTETYHYAAGSELTDITVGAATIAHYDYDAAGRVIHRTRGVVEQQLDYDADDHLVRLADPAGTNEVLWDFDSMGRRVRREDRSAGVTTSVQCFEIAPTLDESLESPHAIADPGGHPEIEYVFAGEHPLLRHDVATGQVSYYLQDAMGSVIGLADAGGIEASINYDAFGVERGTTGTLAALPNDAEGDFRFQGMWLDRGTGFYYVRARQYEAEAGRFVQRDRTQAPREHPTVVAPFAFAEARPTFLTDPAGLFTIGEQPTVIQTRRNLESTTFARYGSYARAFRNARDIARIAGLGSAAQALAERNNWWRRAEPTTTTTDPAPPGLELVDISDVYLAVAAIQEQGYVALSVTIDFTRHELYETVVPIAFVYSPVASINDPWAYQLARLAIRAEPGTRFLGTVVRGHSMLVYPWASATPIMSLSPPMQRGPSAGSGGGPYR